MNDVSTWRRHLRPSIEAAGIYRAEPSTSLARLHANECSEAWPDEVMEAVSEVVRSTELNRYPDTSARSLREVLAGRLGTSPDRIVVGSGSAELTALIFSLFNGAARPVLVVPVPTFAMFANSGRAYGYEVRQVPLRPDFQLDEPAMETALDGATLCVLPRPNNPTGSIYPRALVEKLIHDHPDTLFVIDEAYVDFAPDTSMFDPDAPPNHIHMASLSKCGLAALRVGYCAAHPEIVEMLDRIRMPYNVSQLSIAIAELILTEFDHIRARNVERMIRGREHLREVLSMIPDSVVYPSSSSMVLVSVGTPERAAWMQRRFGELGVQVRDVSREPGIAELGLRGCLRVSAGDAQEMQHLQMAIGRMFYRDVGIVFPSPEQQEIVRDCVQ